MTNYKKRADANQKKIINDLISAGVSVTNLSRFGEGFPDIAAGFRGVNYLIEIKKEGAELTPSEQKWHDEWRGQVQIAHNSTEAFEIVGLAAEWVDDEFDRFMLDCDPAEAEFPCQDLVGGE